jgi:hypothetical protein
MRYVLEKTDSPGKREAAAEALTQLQSQRAANVLTQNLHPNFKDCALAILKVLAHPDCVITSRTFAELVAQHLRECFRRGYFTYEQLELPLQRLESVLK